MAWQFQVTADWKMGFCRMEMENVKMCFLCGNIRDTQFYQHSLRVMSLLEMEKPVFRVHVWWFSPVSLPNLNMLLIRTAPTPGDIQVQTSVTLTDNVLCVRKTTVYASQPVWKSGGLEPLCILRSACICVALKCSQGHIFLKELYLPVSSIKLTSLHGSEKSHFDSGCHWELLLFPFLFLGAGSRRTNCACRMDWVP